MPLPDHYASAATLAAYWGRSLSTAEQTRATDLLGRAATLINEIPGAADENGDLRFSEKACEHVSLDMVKRAMLSRGDGAFETSAEMADMTGTVKYVNPVGNLYLTDQELNRLTGRVGQVGNSITLVSNVRVPGEPWNHQPSSQIED